MKHNFFFLTTIFLNLYLKKLYKNKQKFVSHPNELSNSLSETYLKAKHWTTTQNGIYNPRLSLDVQILQWSILK